MNATLYYVHDPMCSWCWAFRPAYDAIMAELPEEITLKRLLGGLAPDTDEPMPEAMREYVKNHWHSIQKQVPGTEFNFTFWQACNPRRTTYPACRAVIAARNQGAEYDDKMTLAIQHGYYLHARNPSNHDTLIAFADEMDLDTEQFARDRISVETDEILNQEIAFTHRLSVTGFPTMLLETNGDCMQIPTDYIKPETMLKTIQEKI
ncbi:MAG: DsbA family protein [Gammaproteobacteria bacterium]